MFKHKHQKIIQLENLKMVIDHQDSKYLCKATNELMDYVKQDSKIKPLKKLEIYDLLAKITNCNKSERAVYYKKLKKLF